MRWLNIADGHKQYDLIMMKGDIIGGRSIINKIIVPVGCKAVTRTLYIDVHGSLGIIQRYRIPLLNV